MTFLFIANVPEILEIKKKSCENFLIFIDLRLNKFSRRKCVKRGAAITKSFYNSNDTRGGKYLKHLISITNI